eukprot:Skav209364  [mRNA]  locus=scaffold1388:122952:124220:- [translate_table: standard]
MASLIESEAVFAARLKALGLESLLPTFVGKGWKTMSTFAFASSWTPGVGDDSAFKSKVLVPLLGDEDHQDVPKVRKLYYECYTMVAADLRSRIEAGADDGSKVRKLAVAERKSRWESIKAKYPHMNFKSDCMEPAHAVVDKFHTMKLDGDIRYVAPHEIPTRDQELQSVKTEEMIKRDASGHLRAHDQSKVPEADTRTDLRMRQAYTRRGLAMEIADVMTFTAHERLVEKLFTEYQREPPPGYSSISLRQLAEADRRAWKMVAEKSSGDLGRDPSGNPIVDKIMDQVLVDPAFLTLLLPLPGGRASSSKGEEATEANMGAGKRKILRENQKLKDQLRDAKEQRTDKYTAKNGPPVAATKKMPVKMPKELHGLQPMKNKKRLCFGFNLGKCDNQCTDNECERGLHLCMRCWKPGHGAVNCPQK